MEQETFSLLHDPVLATIISTTTVLFHSFGDCYTGQASFSLETANDYVYAAD